MIGDLMALALHPMHEIRVSLGPVTSEKEGRMNMMLCQNIQDMRGRIRWSPCIEGQSDTRSAGIADRYFCR